MPSSLLLRLLVLGALFGPVDRDTEAAPRGQSGTAELADCTVEIAVADSLFGALITSAADAGRLHRHRSGMVRLHPATQKVGRFNQSPCKKKAASRRPRRSEQPAWIKRPSYGVLWQVQRVAQALVPASSCVGHRGPSAWQARTELRRSWGPPSDSHGRDPTWPDIGPGSGCRSSADAASAT